MSNDTFNSNTTSNTKSIAIKFGIITAFVNIIASLILYFANFQFTNWASYITMLLDITIIIWGIKIIRDEHLSGTLQFSDLFKIGMLMTVIMALITVIYFLFYVQFIDTTFIDELLKTKQDQLIEKNLSEEQIEVGMKYTRMFIASPILRSVSGFILHIITGTIASLIGAAIYKKEK